MKVSVFRVEQPNGGAGPYAATADSKVLQHMNAVHSGDDHPDPADDPMLDGIYPDEYCGFATLCDLETWFAGYEDTLADAGYIIAVYTMPLQSVRYGAGQVVFLRADAVPVRCLPMR